MTSKQHHDPGRKKRIQAELRGPEALTRQERRVKRIRERVASYPPKKAPQELMDSFHAAVKNMTHDEPR